MIKRDWREPPAKDQHGRRHFGRAAVDDQNDDEQKAEKPGSDERK
jgi:hypothetical protein